MPISERTIDPLPGPVLDRAGQVFPVQARAIGRRHAMRTIGGTVLLAAVGGFAASCDAGTAVEASKVALPVVITQAVRGLGVISGAGVAFAIATGGVILWDLADEYLQNHDAEQHEVEAAEVMASSGFSASNSPMFHNGDFSIWTSTTVDLRNGCLAMVSSSQLVMFEARALTALGKSAYAAADRWGYSVDDVKEQMLPIGPYAESKMNVELSSEAPSASYNASAGQVQLELDPGPEPTVLLRLPNGGEITSTVPF